MFQPRTACNHTDCCSLLHEAYQQHTAIVLEHDGPHGQQTSQPSTSPIHTASTPCLHVSTSVYGNSTSSPVTMHLRNSWPLIHCCWNERAQAFLSTLWPSDYGNNSHSANTLWNPNSQMILTTVPCDRLKSCCSSVCKSSVWGLNFPHFHVWCVWCCASAISLTIICTDMFRFRVWTPLCHSWPTHHIVPIHSDLLTTNFYWSYIP